MMNIIDSELSHLNRLITGVEELKEVTSLKQSHLSYSAKYALNEAGVEGLNFSAYIGSESVVKKIVGGIKQVIKNIIAKLKEEIKESIEWIKGLFHSKKSVGVQVKELKEQRRKELDELEKKFDEHRAFSHKLQAIGESALGRAKEPSPTNMPDDIYHGKPSINYDIDPKAIKEYNEKIKNQIEKYISTNKSIKEKVNVLARSYWKEAKKPEPGSEMIVKHIDFPPIAINAIGNIDTLNEAHTKFSNSFTRLNKDSIFETETKKITLFYEWLYKGLEDIEKSHLDDKLKTIQLSIINGYIRMIKNIMQIEVEYYKFIHTVESDD